MINNVEKAILPYQEQLLEHSLYKLIDTPLDLQVFMEHHVFAVWDFMSLLKALQIRLTNISTPWYPIGNPEIRYLINEIVLAEETDINLEGKRQSHFEMYLDAMKKAGASTLDIDDLIKNVIHGSDIFLIIAMADIPPSIKAFLKFTFEIIDEGKPHKIAAAFTFGREDLIPGMFTKIIENIQHKFPENDLQLFKYYFDRHIELDGDEHGPMALQMITELCGKDSQKWQEVTDTAINALQHRIILWDGIEEKIKNNLHYIKR